MADTVDAYIAATKQVESGGNYQAIGSEFGELGAYQVLPSNLPSWSTEALGHPVTAQQFLASPELQDAIVLPRLRSNYAKYGAVGAAQVWNGGHVGANVPGYVSKILAAMGSVSTQGITSSGQNQPTNTPGVVSPPYPAQSLSPPLTQTQRAIVIGWIKQVQINVKTGIGIPGGQGYSVDTDPSTLDDATLLKMYSAFIASVSAGPQSYNPITHFFQTLTSKALWVRIGIGIIGVVTIFGAILFLIRKPVTEAATTAAKLA